MNTQRNKPFQRRIQRFLSYVWWFIFFCCSSPSLALCFTQTYITRKVLCHQHGFQWSVYSFNPTRWISAFSSFYKGGNRGIKKLKNLHPIQAASRLHSQNLNVRRLTPKFMLIITRYCPLLLAPCRMIFVISFTPKE